MRTHQNDGLGVGAHPAPPVRPLYATLLGPFGMYRGESRLRLGHSRTVLELCQYLVARLGQAVPREELLELLWPDGDLDRTSHRLHVVVSELRTLLDVRGAGQSAVSCARDAYSMSAPAVSSDCVVFDEHYAAGQARLANGDRRGAAAEFRVAVTLYRGDYLLETPYAEWTYAPRTHYSARRLNALTFLCEQATAEQDLLTALDCAQQILEGDPLRELAHRCLMRTYSAMDDAACALRQYNLCARALQEGLGVEPSDKTRALAEAIRHGHPLPAETPLIRLRLGYA